ncbi:hypothetical protein [Litorivivens lipolytica]|nr:hypothetical protein [Litorivivens lipolytica]
MCGLLVTSTLAAEPCWLSQPVTNEYQGYIGVAEKFDAAGSLAIAASRRSALRQLFAVDGATLPEKFQNDDALLEFAGIDVEGRHFDFTSDYVGRGAVFSYLVTGDHSDDTCVASTCSSQRCEPEWLCGQSSDAESTNVLGVGEWRISDKQQWLDAAKSASETAAYWGIADVSSEYRLLRTAAAQQYLSFIDHTISVETNNRDLPPLTLMESCRDGATLFQRWLYEDRQKFKRYANSNALRGKATVSAYTAAGTLQSVIDLAIHRAYAELAQNKDVRVKSLQKTVSGESTGRGYSMEAVSLSSHHRISASLSRLSITPRVDKPYIVEVELLENTAQ